MHHCRLVKGQAPSTNLGFSFQYSKARTRLSGIEFTMPHHPGIRIIRLQSSYQGIQSLSLRLCARVGRTPLFIQSPFVADPNRITVPPLHMRPLLMEGTTGMDIAIASDVKVVTDIGKPTVQMVSAASLERVVTIASRGTAVQHNQVDQSVVLILTAGEDSTAHTPIPPVQACTPKAVAKAVNTVIAKRSTLPQTDSFSFIN